MSTEGSMALVDKLESLEQSQALEKNKLEVANKQWKAKFDSIEGMMKMHLYQTQKKPISSSVQSARQGSGISNPGRTTVVDTCIMNFSSGSEFICISG